jgi:hypothetical protein
VDEDGRMIETELEGVAGDVTEDMVTDEHLHNICKTCRFQATYLDISNLQSGGLGPLS